MDDRERERIRLIAAHEGSLASRALIDQLGTVLADHSVKGCLHSGATITVSVQAMQALADAYLDNIAGKIKAIAPSAESFALLSEAMLEFLNVCGNAMPGILKLARGGRLVAGNDSIAVAGMALFNQMRADIDARLSILAYEFETVPAIDNEAVQPVETLNMAKLGGRPPAAFWDDLWAAIAVALYVGELIPKTQADIERAMADWLEVNKKSAAPSTIRARARRLWDGIAASER